MSSTAAFGLTGVCTRARMTQSLILTTPGNGGSIRGATLTLPIQWSFILLAFLALFINLVGGYLWGSICFTIHQIKASFDDQDDIHNQIQLVLRNSEHESTLVWRLFNIGLAHKRARFDVSRRSVLLVALAIAHGLGISAAGGLSSRFIAVGNEVQTLPTSCGWMKEDNFENVTDATWDTTNALVVMARYRYRKSATYARSCYGQVGGTLAACGTNFQTALPYNINTSAPCPFDEKICNGSAISIDTGFLRSDLHLGMNTRPEDSISIRKSLTCVPLAGEKYSDGWKNGTLIAGATVPAKAYQFGPDVRNENLANNTFIIADPAFFAGDQPYYIA
jgi:hypothetical protein